MSWLIAALQLAVAPILAGAFTLWAALIALAAEAEATLPRLLVPDGEERSGLTPGRGLHVLHLALLAAAAFFSGIALAWWAWRPLEAGLRLILSVALVWVVGDLLPRLWAANEPGFIRADGRIATVSLTLFQPFLRLVAWADRGGRNEEAPDALRHRVNHEVRERLAGVFALRDMTVAEVMTPRMDVVSVDLSATRGHLLETFRATEHSRLLVVDGDPDNVVGVIYAKDLLAELDRAAGESDWHGLVRPVEYVPDAKRLDRQLRDFQRGRAHLVVVVDEYGGTSGIVTMEDVLEQIVGEIQDEYDTEEVVPIERKEDGSLAVLGNVPLVDLESELDHSFHQEDVDTVGGLVLALAGRVPRVGETIVAGEIALTIDQVSRRRVLRVTVRPVVVPVAERAGDEVDG